MAETAVNAYAVTGANTAAGAPTPVAVVSDGTGDRQIVVLGAGDGTTTLVDGTAANPLNVTDTALISLTQTLLDLIGVLRDGQNDIPYARDSSDQMRVSVSSGVVTSTMAMWSNGSYASYYATGGPNSVDMRELMEITAQENFNITRNDRWAFS